MREKKRKEETKREKERGGRKEREREKGGKGKGGAKSENRKNIYNDGGVWRTVEYKSFLGAWGVDGEP